WGVNGTLSDVQLDSDHIASWDIETSGPNWHVSTRYEFVRLEQQIRTNLAQPLWQQLARALHWIGDDLSAGALGRVFRALWRMGVLLSYSQVLLLLWLGLSIGGGWLAGLIASDYGAPLIAQVCAGLLGTVIAFLLLRFVTEAMFVNQLNNCWPYLREF